MRDYESIRAVIDANINKNGRQAITGQILNSVLKALVDNLGFGFQYVSTATPAIDPGVIDSKVFYVAFTPGRYEHFGDIVINEGEVALIKHSEGQWTKESINVATKVSVDEIKTQVEGLESSLTGITEALAGKMSFVELSSDGNTITMKDEETPLTYQQIKVMVDDPSKFVALKYGDMWWLLPQYDDGGAIIFTGTSLMSAQGSLDRVAINTENNVSSYSIAIENKFLKVDDLNRELIDTFPTYPTTRAVNTKFIELERKVDGNSLFNANVYLYGKDDYTHTLTLQEAINAARDAGVNSVARAITYFDTDGAKLAIFNTNIINTGFTNPAYWRVLDLGKIANDIANVNTRIKNLGEYLNGRISGLYDAIYQYVRDAALTVLATNNGYYMATDGTLVANSTYRVVKYQITNQTDIVVSGRSVGVAQLAIAFDSSNNIIESFEIGTAHDYSNFHISVPRNTAYVCVTGYNNTGIYQPSAYSVTLQKTFYTKVEADATFAKIENVGALINTALDSFKVNNLIIGDEELITGGTEEQFYVYSEQTIGSPITFGTHSKHRVFENIPANSIVRISITTGGAYGFALTDQDDNVLEYCINDRTEYTFAAYNRITKLYVSPNHFVNAYKRIPQEIKKAVSNLMPRVTTLENTVGSLNYWHGKRIWWCGTSIPAGSDATLGSEETIAGNYPKQVGENLGATVNNEAVGGSMCRANVRTGDYTGANFSNITSALSMTREEIENFITNYDSIKGRLQGAPVSLSNSDINRLRAASFETKLLPYLDGTKPMPDLFVIDHGHNDFKYTLAGGGSDIQLQPTVQNITDNILAADTYMTANNNAKLESFMGSLANIPSASKADFIASLNRNCYIGAINFIVTLILRYNPKARIVFISNYEYENGANKQYAPLIPAQESIAKSWAFPLCRVYEFVGFSDHIIPNSMAWFNTTYPGVTPATSDVTVFRDYNPDGVHPHSDITGNANKIYAGVISEFIKQCR